MLASALPSRDRGRRSHRSRGISKQESPAKAEDPLSSIPHTRRCAQRRQDRTRNRYNDLRNKLSSLLLRHNSPPFSSLIVIPSSLLVIPSVAEGSLNLRQRDDPNRG